MDEELKQYFKSAGWDLLYGYGYKKVLAKIKEYEELENFEACQAFKEVIEDHNKLVKDNLPTKL